MKKETNIDLRKAIAKHCKNKDCNNLLSHWNKSGVCSNCQNGSKWKQKYDDVRAEFDRHLEFCKILHLEMYNKLKKYEPDITWGEEPE